MSDAARRVRAFLMTLSEEDRAWLADELAESLEKGPAKENPQQAETDSAKTPPRERTPRSES